MILYRHCRTNFNSNLEFPLISTEFIKWYNLKLIFSNTRYILFYILLNNDYDVVVTFLNCRFWGGVIASSICTRHLFFKYIVQVLTLPQERSEPHSHLHPGKLIPKYSKIIQWSTGWCCITSYHFKNRKMFLKASENRHLHKTCLVENNCSSPSKN